MSQQLLEKIRRDFSVMNANYISVPPIEQYIRLPRVEGNGSATVGDFAMAVELLK